jgi:hypothetical protein
MKDWGSSIIVYVSRVDNLRYNCKFVSTNDDYVWKDTPNQKSVDAAFYGKKDRAKTIPYKYVDEVRWTPVEIISGYYARKKENKESSGKVGDTPFEAVSYLDFDNKYSIDRDPITESKELEQQVFDILRYHTGSVHYTTLNNYLNEELLDDEDITNKRIKEYLVELSKNTNVYSTTNNKKWWSIRN